MDNKGSKIDNRTYPGNATANEARFASLESGGDKFDKSTWWWLALKPVTSGIKPKESETACLRGEQLHPWSMLCIFL